MSQHNLAGQIMNLLYENSKLLCVWLEKHLPSIEPRWWESMVLPALSYQQRQRAEAQGFTSLNQFDLAALLRILDQNWYPISQHRNLTTQDRHFVKEMQTIRNRWAHMNADGISSDDAYRDIDTIQRLSALFGGDRNFLEEIKTLKTKALASNNSVDSSKEIKAMEKIPLANESQNLHAVPMTIQVGSLVCLISSPDKQGAVIALEGSTPDARCTVFMDGKPQPFYLSQIQPIADNQKKNIVPLSELHNLLTCLQVNHPSMATLYSLNAARIDFVPYQFRPALKIIHADQPRILIADGVGVGKTIEAGLIMRELQARNEINSVLIICPKPLITERKWELEMKRFDERFTQLDGNDLRLCIEETHVEGDWPEQHKKTIIPYSLFDEKNLHGEKEGRKKRRGLLDLDPPPRFDLVIVDEAHHIRNASTYAHDAVRLFCEHAEAVVFLTATPIQLGNQDLFTLLNVLRPDLIIDQESFSHMTEPNSFTNRAIKEARSGGSDWQENAVKALQESSSTAWGQAILSGNPEFQGAMRDLTEKTLSREERVSMIGTLESFHSLSRIINRTRRRDVGSFCTRRPETIEIAFTPDQQEIHDQLLDFEAKALSTLHGQQNVKFMMSTIRRQTASCIFGLAPFIKDILERRLSDLDWSEIGEYEETGQIDDFISELRSQAESIAAKARTLPEDDPKFDALADVIAQKQGQNNNKVIIFSSFRHTLSYLERKLKESGIRLAVIHGGVKDEDRVLLREKFELPKENAEAIDVMLFSEVGCEGLDYQFCDMMINYDLPWNPMKIEQRIGRIDRRGQKSEAVSIFNFITPGTVDADIYIRCLQRIGIFESSIGDCESILGDISQEIKNIGESVELTPEERQKKLEQLADNEIRQIQEQKQLEDKEFELFGIRVPQGQIEAEIQKADSYWLRPSSLQKFIEGYLTKRLGKGDYILGETPLKTLRISQEARQVLLDDFLKLPKKKSPTHQSWHTWLKGGDQHLSITFDSATATDQRNATFLTPVHSLILQAASFMEMAEPVYIAMKISNQGVPPGDYPFAIYAWEFRGLRSELQMVSVCSNEILQKDLTDYLESGASVEISESKFNDGVFGNLDKEHHKLWDIKKKSHAAQTHEMCAYRRESLKTSHTGRISILTRQLEKANNDNIRRMKQAQISNVQADFEKKMKLIEIAENGADIHARPVVFGILRVTE